MTTGDSVDLESGLEYDLLRRLDRNPDVTWLVGQPVRLEFSVRRKRQRMKHTPDLLSVAVDGRCTLWDARPRKDQDQLFAFKSQLTADACREVGWEHEVFQGLSPVERLNLLWLHPSRRRPPWCDEAEPLLEDFLTSGSRRVGDVLALDRGSGHITSVLWHLMWRGSIDCDLMLPLTGDTQLGWNGLPGGRV